MHLFSLQLRQSAISRRRRPVPPLAALLCLALGSAPVLHAEATPGSGADPSSEPAAACERLASGPNTYFSDRLLRELEQRLAGELDPLEASAVRGLYGRELLKQGRLEEAIAELERSLEEARRQRRSDRLESAVHWNLALAHLRLAEQENCVGHRTAASCIVPIRPEAVHPLPRHARRAGDLFLEYARANPENVQAIWLLDLARRVSGDWPEGVPPALRIPEERFGSGSAFPLWTDRALELGLAVNDLAGGAVLDDFDGDGRLDVVTSTWDPCGGMKAFRNDGRGGFEPVAAAWGLADQLGGLNLVHADYDGDGRLDLLLLRGAWLLGEGRIRNSLLRNERTEDGGTRFRDVTREAGLAEPAYPTQAAAWADFDGDGDLDLFVGNEATEANPYPSQLFRNRGDGTFEDVAPASGVTNLRYTKGATWGDWDNDGDPDLFVSNFGPNRLYRNDGADDDGTWRFVDVAPELGVTAPERESFATWFFDHDNDGDLDLFVADYRQKAAQVTASYLGASFDDGQPLLYRNLLTESGEPGFEEVSREIGITRPAMPMGANFGDLDNDGWLDFYLGTGEPDLAGLMPNVMYRNRGDGTFEDVTFAGGFGHLQKGHGVAFGDVDGDGDQDLLHQLGGFYPVDTYGNALFENPGTPAHWITLRLEGRRANRFGLGARLRLVVEEEDGRRREIHRQLSSGGSFGGSSLQQEIGLGAAVALRVLEVRWPGSGTVDRFEEVELDRVWRLVEGGEPEPVPLAPIRLGERGQR